MPLQQAVAAVDDRFLTLLAMLGPQAVTADPALIVRLSRKLPALPALAESRRRLLGLRLDLDGEGFAQGQGSAVSERAGVQRGGAIFEFVGALSNSGKLPDSVLQARQARGELLYSRQSRPRAPEASRGGAVAGRIAGEFRTDRGHDAAGSLHPGQHAVASPGAGMARDRRRSRETAARSLNSRPTWCRSGPGELSSR